MAKVTLTSSDLKEGSLIDINYKNNICCNSYNDSPELKWTIDFKESFVDHFNLYCTCDNLKSQRIYSPNEDFILWEVTNISIKQKPFLDGSYGIERNGYWNTTKVNVFKTDFESGDRINGWNGPCSPDENNYTYRIWIEAILKTDSATKKVFGETTFIKSNIITVIDNKTNIKDFVNVNDCDKIICPTGYEYNEEDEKCYLYESAAAGERNVFDGQWLQGNQSLNFDLYDLINNDELNVESTLGQDVWYPDTRSYSFEKLKTIQFCSTTSNLFKLGYLVDSSLHFSGYYTNFSLNKGGLSFNNIDNGNYILLISSGSPNINNRERIYKIYINNSIINYNIHLIKEYEAVHGEGETLQTVIYDAFLFTVDDNTIDIKITAEGNCSELSFTFGFSKYIESTTVYDETTVGNTQILDRIYYSLENNSYSLPNTKYITNKGWNFATEAEAQKIVCYYRIKQCTTNKEYKIKLKRDTYLRNGYIYTFGYDSEFSDPVTNNPYCFEVLEYVVDGEDKDIIKEVELIAEIGPATQERICTLCNSIHKFVSCDTNAKYPEVITTLNVASIYPVQDKIYNMSFCEHTGEFNHYEFNTEEFSVETKKNCECYKYEGITDEEQTHSNLLVKTDYDTTKCGVCDGCYRFRDCLTDQFIIVSFKQGETKLTTADIGKIYKLKGNEDIENIGWKFFALEDCNYAIDYEDIQIDVDYNSTDCNIVYPFYKLTNCTDSEDVKYVRMVSGDKLDTTRSFVFEESPYCYTATVLAPTNPVEGEWQSMGPSEDYVDCEECNKTCFCIEDCLTGNRIKPTDQSEISKYNGRTIKYSVEDDDIRCGSVKSYRCHAFDYEEKIVKLYMGCFDSCEQCLETYEETVDYSIRHRAVAPGQKEYECCDSKPQKSCEIKKCCCNGYVKVSQ